MTSFDTKKIKNVAIVGHAGSGKTSFVEAMLFEAGETTRRGTVEDKNTVSDHHALEQERGNSLFSTLMHVTWKDNKINIIDTPGYDDFIGEVVSSLRVSDTAVVVLNATKGVEVGTETIWSTVERHKLPALFVVNQMDNDKSDFDTTVDQAKSRFGDNVVMVQYPMEQGVGFNAIVDVLKMVVYKFPDGGGKPEKLPIPDSEKEKANQLHNDLIEAIAVNDEGLMEQYFEKGELTEEEMSEGLRKSMVNHDIFPLFISSATRNMGTGRVMGFLRDIGPSSADVPPVSRKSGKLLPCDPNGPLCLFVYKTISEPHLGEMSFFKVYSGTLTTGSDLINSISGASERINQLFLMNGKNRETVNSLSAGDIGCTVKLKNTDTNSTLHEKAHPFNILPIAFPGPRIQEAVTTDNKNDMEKLAQSLMILRNEDPTIVLENSKELGQLLVSAQGQLHLSMIKWKLKHNYKVEFNYEEPKIAFRETIRGSVKEMYRHKKQSGGSGQFGEVHMLIEAYTEGMPPPAGLTVRRSPEIIPLDWGGNLVFYNCIVGGSIDAKYMNAIIKGIMEKMENGPLTGSYVRDIRVSVYDGKMHAVDSNDMAFKLAASQAFKNGFQKAKPQLLEPIYDVEVLVDPEMTGDVMGDLQTRRAIIMGMDTAGHYQTIKARVPLMELYRYASALRSITQGGAKHTQTFAEYQPVPADVQQKLVDAHQTATAEA